MIMKYILILPNGKIMTFNIEAAMQIFKQAYGGTIVEGNMTFERARVISKV